MNTRRITVGARGSALSVIQAQGIIKTLQKEFPRGSFAFKRITTLGDKANRWQRNEVGVFVKELEEALSRKEIDIAVHSVKDMPSSLPYGLMLAAVPKREDPRDCMLTREKASLTQLKKNARIGTSSLRRSAQLLRARADLRITHIKGNVDTRIKKLLSGEFDAIVIALAGLTRLGYSTGAQENFFIQPLSLLEMLPACGQGALGIEVRSNDSRILRMVKKINHEASFVRVSAERAFLKEFGAGCRVPVGGFAAIKDNQLYFEGMVARADGKKIIRLKAKAALSEAQALGRRVAKEILKKADKDIVESFRQ